MRLMDIYDNVESPLNDETLKKLLEIFGLGVSLYHNVTNCSDKDYSNIEGGICRPQFNKADQDKFYAMVTNLWKKNLKANKKHNLYSETTNQDFIYFINNIEPFLDQDITNYNEAFTLLYGKNIEDPKLKQCLRKFRWNNDNSSSWEHVFSTNILGLYQRNYPVDHRLYINPDSCDLFEFMNYFVEKCHDRKQHYYFKFDKGFERDDLFVLYCSTENLGRHLDILNEIEKEHPDLISKFHTPPLMTGKINNWIGYGAEPNYAYEKTGRRYSYTSLRVEDIITPSIYEATNEWINENMNTEINVKGKNRTFRDIICHMAVNEVVKTMKKDIENKTTEEAINSLGFCNSDIENPKVLTNIYNLVNLQIKDDLNDFFTQKKDFCELEMYVRGNKKYNYFGFSKVFKDLPRRIAMTDPMYLEKLKKSITKKSLEYGVDPDKFFVDENTKKLFEEQDLKIQKSTQLNNMFDDNTKNNNIDENKKNNTNNNGKK